MPANDQRQDYVRARVERTAGRPGGDAVRGAGFLDAEDCSPTPTG